MKKTIKKIPYDTGQDIPKCSYRYGNPVGSIVETSYLTPSGHWYLLQQVEGKPPAIIPMTNEDMAIWAAPSKRDTPYCKR